MRGDLEQNEEDACPRNVFPCEPGSKLVRRFPQVARKSLDVVEHLLLISISSNRRADRPDWARALLPSEKANDESEMRPFGRVHRWQDWLSFALALWLAVSPWIVGYAQHDGATANAVYVGLGLALASHFEATFDLSAEWLNFAAGLWLMAAPFTLGFAAVSAATVTAMAVGTLVALLACSAMSLGRGLGSWWHRHFAGH